MNPRTSIEKFRDKTRKYETIQEHIKMPTIVHTESDQLSSTRKPKL